MPSDGYHTAPATLGLFYVNKSEGVRIAFIFFSQTIQCNFKIRVLNLQTSLECIHSDGYYIAPATLGVKL